MFKEYEKIIEELNKKDITVLDLEVTSEVIWQLELSEKNTTDEEKQKIFNYVKNIYLETENLSVEAVARCIIDNFQDIDKMDYHKIIRRTYDYI